MARARAQSTITRTRARFANLASTDACASVARMIRLTIALYVTVLGWMNGLAPGRDHSALAWAVAVNAQSETEAAVITAVAFRESSLIADAVGDGGHSKC